MNFQELMMLIIALCFVAMTAIATTHFVMQIILQQRLGHLLEEAAEEDEEEDDDEYFDR